MQVALMGSLGAPQDSRWTGDWELPNAIWKLGLCCTHRIYNEVLFLAMSCSATSAKIHYLDLSSLVLFSELNFSYFNNHLFPSFKSVIF